MNLLRRHETTQRSFAGLVLACVFALQLVSLGHDAQHSIGDLDESCQICLQQNGNAPLEHSVDHSMELPRSSAPVLEAGITSALQPLRRTTTRAPPSI